MSERSRPAAARAILCRAFCVLLLAATTAACDACGNFVPPIRLQADQHVDVCRDSPKPR
jgi:hypothetical protein